MVRTRKMPNQIGEKPRSVTMGSRMGVVSSISARPSSTEPSSSSNRVMTMIAIIGLAVQSVHQRGDLFGQPRKAHEDREDQRADDDHVKHAGGLERLRERFAQRLPGQSLATYAQSTQGQQRAHGRGLGRGEPAHRNSGEHEHHQRREIQHAENRGASLRP